MTRDEIVALRKRVIQFQTLSLPGQPKIIHVGTSSLISDLLHALEIALTSPSLSLAPASDPGRGVSEADEQEAKMLVHQCIRAHGETKDADRLDAILEALKWYRTDWARLVAAHNAALSAPAVPQEVEGEAPDMSDDIRVPLHSLQADLDYLLGRYATEVESRPMIREAFADRLRDLGSAILEAHTNGR